MLSFHRFIHIEHERKCCLSTSFRTVHQFFHLYSTAGTSNTTQTSCVLSTLCLIQTTYHAPPNLYGGDIANVPIPPYVYQEPIHHILPVIYGGDVKNVSIPAVCCPHFVHYDRYLSLCKHFLSAVFPHKLIVN